MIDLTAFQQNCLFVIASHEREFGETPHGLAVKDGLETLYDEEINHGRLYPNLDELVDIGFVNKTERDKRTNAYALTDAGAEAIGQHVRFIRYALGDPVENPYDFDGRTQEREEPAPADD